MPTVKDIHAFLNAWAPAATQMEFDNAGFLVGQAEQEVARILLALDITKTVVEEAIEQNAQLIVSHHPVLFRPVKQITDGSVTGGLLLLLIQNQIAAICMHTNLDVASGGVSDALARRAGLTELDWLSFGGLDEHGQPFGLGRMGILNQTAPPSAKAYATQLKSALDANGIRYYSAGRPVFRVAVGAGSCGDYLGLAAEKGCDTFVTADVKYDVFLEAAALGINLIDAGHFPTENVIVPVLQTRLQTQFPQIETLISQKHAEVVCYL